jgi:two-component system, chemotaxis family, protein-glutamate methylesterase/glutaminase
MIRVVVAEDSATARALLVEIFASDPEFQVVGEATNGNEAVELTRKLRPDLVTMDVRMPHMDGLEATRRIMVEMPTPIVVVSATLGDDDVAASMRAIRAGALSALAKPQGPSAPDFEATRLRFLATVRALSSVKVVGHRLRSLAKHWPAPRNARGSSRPPARARASIVALAASTGGPGALRSVLDALPYDFPVPVVIVQHLSPGFLAGFATWLGTSCRLPVRVAVEGDHLARATVYIAPEDRHLTITPSGQVHALNDAPVDGFRPSASVLFESIANVYGSSAVCAILTGMGRDGVHGLRRIRELGGRIIAQDEHTSSVFGMPAAAIEEGLADFILPISMVPAKLVEMVGQESKE